MAARRREDGWRNRIVGEGEERPEELAANPLNWRVHPKRQTDALAGLLGEVGWVQRVIVNKRTGHIVDGHARVGLAIARKEAAVPVVYVDLAPEEERLVLAALDPIGAMAGADDALLRALLDDVTTGDAALQQVLADTAAATGEDWSGAIGEMLDGGDSGEGLHGVRFILTTAQRDDVMGAVRSAHGRAPEGETGNRNTNGNALWWIVTQAPS